MNIYIDESGSINNKLSPNTDFVISLILVLDKKRLERKYKRFVSKYLKELEVLDNKKENNKMFNNGKFIELKGSKFDLTMKKNFVKYFSKDKSFEVFYIRVKNDKLSDKFCSNPNRAFNYLLNKMITHLIISGLLPKEDCNIQLDERNERTESVFFLEEYLNTELSINNFDFNVNVKYFDSASNKFIQLADIFSNLYYSHLVTKNYDNEIKKLRSLGIIRKIFEFPIDNIY